MSPDTARADAPRRTVLVTGAGGPAGIAVIRSLQDHPGVTVLAADMSPLASGLYLLPAERRWIVPAGADPGFVSAVLGRVIREGVDAVVPTVDAELLALGAARASFQAAGVRLAIASDQALRVTLDKLQLARRCAATVRIPRTEPLGAAALRVDWLFPVIVKPRSGSGSRGVRTVHDRAGLARLAAAADAAEATAATAEGRTGGVDGIAGLDGLDGLDGGGGGEPGRGGETGEPMIVQEFLPGEEYSVDVLADLDGRVVAAVPRSRLRIDSGVAVAGRTLRDPLLEQLARATVEATGLSLVANVQARRDREGLPRLLEVNPRFPGSMPLTVASGVDMPRLMIDILFGLGAPAHVAHRPMMNVRFLEDRFFSPQEAEPLFAQEADLREAGLREAGSRAGAAAAAVPR